MTDCKIGENVVGVVGVVVVARAIAIHVRKVVAIVVIGRTKPPHARGLNDYCFY